MSEPEAGWVCYLLECADGTLYAGITNDTAKRLAAHNAGHGAKYTRSRLPVRYVWLEPCADRAAASRREFAVKRLPRAAKLDLIQVAASRVEFADKYQTSEINDVAQVDCFYPARPV